MSTQENAGSQEKSRPRKNSTNNAAELKKAALSDAQNMRQSNASLANFMVHAIKATDEQDLAAYSAEQFREILEHSFAHFGQRRPNEHLIHIWKPREDDPHGVQIIDIFLTDMPFVVDSTLAAIRAMGGTICMFIHPILPIDKTVKPWKVLEKGEQGSSSESFLQVHINPINDEVGLAGLFAELDMVLLEVRRTVRGWRPMLERLKGLVQSYRENPPDVSAPVLAESLHFLLWLADHNFTFLGMREYALDGSGGKATLVPIKESGLGILEDPSFFFLRKGDQYVEMTEQHMVFLQKSDPVMVTKANVQSRVHRRTHMDYIGIKLFDKKGALCGELRILGLFTSMSLATPHTDVPLVRRKVSEVMRRSTFEPNSHAGKALMAALENYPREELFQIGENQLFEFATLIAALPDRPRVRVLPRIDRFDNFVSILLFLPRERYDSEIRARVGQYLAKRYDGRVSAYYPHFPEGEMVRVHYIIGRNGGKTPRPDRIEMENEIVALIRSFGDRISSAAKDPADVADFTDAFSPGYQSANTHLDALADIEIVKSLKGADDIAVRLGSPNSRPDELVLKVYHLEQPIPLSTRVPMLENFGFSVIDESSYLIRPKTGPKAFLHEMQIELVNNQAVDQAADHAVDIDEFNPRLERNIKAIWAGVCENDGLNHLAISAAMEWDDISILRALVRYMRQIGISYSQHYTWEALNSHGDIARHLIALFHTLHDPEYKGDRQKTGEEISKKILGALEQITSIDQDRIIRHLLNLVENSLRTNFFQRDKNGARRPALAIKFNSRKIDSLPEPHPYREILVYSPRLEGIHLRGGAIARGGLRWSDRPEDFRTEILGLLKAQMTKNAVIVPVGSKGGFVPKKMPKNPDRETFLAEGIACYKIFIGALLDLTDNLDGEKVLPPEMIVRRDGDDPYLVVAADKGTSSFSDIANAISETRNFWLGDAFASGGSDGYDHKKMGITARGTFEAVKRHFREIDHNLESEPFSCAGVGDMSGDVFGNGMLLSRHTHLIAAFDHRDIFIDPDPDPEISFAERKRIFDLDRSSWKDYNRELISKGGGVFSRNVKSISLSKEARAVLDIDKEKVTPQEVMRAILMARVDLLWFGGIGTYVRSSGETNAEAGDKANDNIRIEAKQLRAKAIGEGANLGITQLARIEFALDGGAIDTDAIHNSAGVNSSDLEVNIKIALGTLVREGEMSLDERNEFLAEMTDEVAELCLRNNYLQTLTLSLTRREGMDGFADLAGLMQSLENAGELDRAVEYLPDDTELAERAASETPLTRPEISILLAYAKNTLYAKLLKSPVPDDPYLGKELYRYFPSRLTGKQPQTIENHRLRREVIATVLANAMINRGGPAYIHKMTSATTADPALVAFAYAAARDSFGLTELNAAIDNEDNKITGAVQLSLYAEVQSLLIKQTLWFLRNVSFDTGLSDIVKKYAAGVEEIRADLAALLPPFIAKSVADQAAGFEKGGTPPALARRIAELSALTLSSDIVFLAEQAKAPVRLAAQGYFAVLERFRLGRITEQAHTVKVRDHYDIMALDRALANVMRAQRDLSEDVLAAGDGSIKERMANWNNAYAEEIARIEKMIAELTEGKLTVSRLAVAAGLLSDLARH
ncbi:NAD-specific glutamate dehydrogenase, large form [hydrothermal vent metagenome]|uniref:NAD-specific glutamate dehydrogenase, large form n=1 Tax=hydrothermal vent metagenome TaxID=652676 RepID=A0A3B0TST8_9ZZZZ